MPPLITDRHEFEELVDALLREDSRGSYGKMHLVCIQPMIEGHDWHRLLPKATVIAPSSGTPPPPKTSSALWTFPNRNVHS